MLSLLLGNCSAWLPSAAQSSSQGKAALRTGDYAAARAHFESALKFKPHDEEIQIGLLGTLRETGSYAEAESLAEEFLKKREDSASLHLERGRIAVERGDYTGAERHLRRCIALAGSREGSLRLDGMKALGNMLENLGRREEARALWDQLIHAYRAGQVRGSQALGDVAVAAWRTGLVQDAKDIFIDATDEKSGGEISPEALSDFGYLFLEKYNATDAMGVFRDCLKINKSYPPALLGMARAKEYDSSAETEGFVRAALKANPNLVPAITLLAELSIQEENYDYALKELRRAQSINASDLEALSLEAVCHQFRGDLETFARIEKKILGINPSYGRLYHTLAESSVTRRKYREAVENERKAIKLDPQLWPAYTSMGMNLMRIGDLMAGRMALQQAFEGDPYNVWAYNTLDLLDQMDKFVRTKSEHFTFLMSREDEPSLSAHAPRLAEEAYASLTRRYNFVPEGPVQVEIFPDHGGFAVRTLGLPGLGALGVSFGKVVALDSPRARSQGAFNWGSTLWHEFAHVITLQMTNHNIPRWYSEGISVYEERRARPGWGDDLTAAFVKAYKEGRLLKVSDLNSGMMRPKSPEQIGLSYYQASLVCEMIEERFGFEKIRQSLNLFAEGKYAGDVFHRVLGWDSATLDKEYAGFLEARLRDAAAHLDFRQAADVKSLHPETGDKKALTEVLEKEPDDFFANLQMGNLLREEKANRTAEAYLKKAQKLFPEYTGPGSPYQILADMYLEENREEDALAQLLAWTRIDETVLSPLLRAAEIYRKRKDWSSAAKLLELSVYIQPYDTDTHLRLGEVAEQAGDWPRAAAAFQVLVGLNPPDPAGAHYNLARALLGSGRRQEAKREVLRALEIAPSFEKAQQLLLKLSGGQP